MAHQPIWRPEVTKPDRPEAIPGETLLPAMPPASVTAMRNPESDFAQLAADMANDAPADLSAELVLLNGIAEQACLATGATGAAIALVRGEKMVCRASNGEGAPEFGSQLDMSSGLSGMCARTLKVQYCDDALSDQSSEAEAPRQPWVRSAVVMPLLLHEELVGVFEIYSPRAYAFGDRDLRTLEVLASRILKNVQFRQSSWISGGHTLASFEPAATPENVVEDIEQPLEPFEPFAPLRPEPEPITRIRFASAFERFTVVTGIFILCVATLMTTGLSVRLGWWTAKTKPKASHKAATVAAAPNAPPALVSTPPATVPVQQANTNAAVVAQPTPKNKSASPSASTRQESSRGESLQQASSRLPEGGLRIYENGKEIFQAPPTSYDAAASPADSGEQIAPVVQLASIVELSSEAAQSSLVRRVEPQYPEQAITRHIQGPVLLDVRADRKGDVQDIKLVSGDPILAEAAIAAVRQWQFKPPKVNGQPVEMQTKITLRFSLPPS
ncbi:MAG: TonB family protein [Candidatus Sulfotelmatobacter sp.]